MAHESNSNDWKQTYNITFTMKDIQLTMKNQRCIRNVTFISDFNHGCTTLIDCLLTKFGIISRNVSIQSRFMDTRDDEQIKCMTIKSKPISLYYDREKNNDEKESYLLHIIDTPGNSAFNAEVTSALVLCDGIVLVVDCIYGVTSQTKSLLIQAIHEQTVPVLFVNKLDQMFSKHWNTAQIYSKLMNILESINVVKTTCKQADELSKFNGGLLLPQNKNVAFGSGIQAWGFSIKTFAAMYSCKFALPTKKLIKKLWGPNYYDPVQSKWVTKNMNGKLLTGFEKFILKPLQILYNAIINEQEDIYNPIIYSLGLQFTKEEQTYIKNVCTQERLLRLIFSKWLPVNNILLKMMTKHLPSPLITNYYKYKKMYGGYKSMYASMPTQFVKIELKRFLERYQRGAFLFCYDIINGYLFDNSNNFYCKTYSRSTSNISEMPAVSAEKLDTNGPLIMYISKMFPTAEKGRFYAFGRVFSGTIHTGQEVRIMGPQYESGGKKDLYMKKIQRMVILMGKYVERIDECPAGNLCGLVGIDQYLLKRGTLSNHKEILPFTTVYNNIPLVMKVAVQPTVAQDLPKLIEGLKRLSKSDQSIKCSHSKSGQHIIEGLNELHIEIALNDLKKDYMKGAAITISGPMVTYRETITTVSGSDKTFPKICMSKSPNKHHRLYMCAEPLCDEIVNDIDNDVLVRVKDYKQSDLIGKYNLSEKGKFVKIIKIWTFGYPPECRANLLVDMTKGVDFNQYNAMDHIISGFKYASSGGVLCDEAMRGIRFNIMDASIRQVWIRIPNAGQIYPMARNVLYGCQLASTPRLMEPIYSVNILCKQSQHSVVFDVMNGRRGVIQKIEDLAGTVLSEVQCVLPVVESFGLATVLKRKNITNVQMKFCDWEVLREDKTERVILNVRKRKGLKVELPNFDDYCKKY
eukprot:294489_1